MRIFLLLLLAGLIGTAAALPLPLSNKEIALMLRSGYSSSTILAEVASRRVREPLDPATKKALAEFNASPELIAALEGNAYAASSTQTEEAKQKETKIAASRAAQVERDQKFNTLYQAQQQAARAKSADAPAAGGTLILDALKTRLVRCHDGSISPATGTELENKKYVALYYSAHWCAPCRKFTPELIDYYNRIAAAHPEFELIFVSSDRSRFSWETYIRETKMPWLAVNYEQLAELAGVSEIGGKSLPSLVVLDNGSRIVASSYDGEKYLGPQNALATLDQLFGQPPAAPVASR
ncbi:MAG: thioredoxin-like domain-containing protein [Chthoniobacterales bacterium]